MFGLAGPETDCTARRHPCSHPAEHGMSPLLLGVVLPSSHCQMEDLLQCFFILLSLDPGYIGEVVVMVVTLPS